MKWIVLCLFLLGSRLQSQELAIGSLFKNEAPFLREWIEYHRMVGVEHFWLYNDNSTDNWQEVLAPYIKDGLVEVFHWPVSSRADYVGTQCRAFRDAMKRAVGNTTWVALIDIDEFLLPMRNRTVPECLKEHFSEARAVYVSWRNFGTGGVRVPANEPFLGKLFACSFRGHPKNCSGKSIVRPAYVQFEDIWYPHHFPLIDTHKGYMNGDKEFMPCEGIDVKTDGKHHDKYLRINHYVLRDENFYENVRLVRAKQGYGDGGLPLLLEHHELFSKIEDKKLIEFIQKNHPDKYEAMWKRYEK